MKLMRAIALVDYEQVSYLGFVTTYAVTVYGE